MNIKTKAVVFGVLFVGLFSFANACLAVSVTITNPDEEITGSSKICIYDGHGITRTIQVPKSSHCPQAKTFETDDEDE